MPDTPPVWLPDGSALLPDGTLITPAEARAAVDRVLALCASVQAELEGLLS